MKRLALITLFVAACAPGGDIDRVQEKETAALASEAHAQVGMPDIINWTERRQFRDILELRDEPELSTYTYIVNMQGQLLPLCQSIGYGLPYSVQYTNPLREERSGQGGFALPQPDPNGLFMPSGLAATWVLCLDPTTGTVDPVYVEPAIIVSRFELDFGGWENP
jgi:hypothetical protein